MKIPNQPNQPGTNPQAAAKTGGKPELALENFKLETIRKNIDKRPQSALHALGEWRGGEGHSRQSVRWSLEQCPLKIWMEPSEDPTFPGEKLMFATLRQWEIASEGLIRFRLMDKVTESQDTADIVFKWSRETVKGRDYEVGHANRQVQGQRIRRVEITLIEEPLIDGHLTLDKRRSRLLATVLHEVGHALGLEHSESSQDVMYHRGWQRNTLSQSDIHRLQELYRDVVRTI